MQKIFYYLWVKIDRPDNIILNFLYHGELKLNKNHKYYYVLHSPASQIKNRYEFIKTHCNDFKDLTFVAVSKMVKREAKPYINNKRCEVICNCVDLHLFKPLDNNVSEEQALNLNLITAAAFEERKGMQFMIKALSTYSQINQIKYNIYGSGPYFLELEQLIAYYKLGNYIIINKAVDNLHEILPANDLFVLLSKGEAMPIAPLEAMASGLPLLVSNYEPYPEFVNESFGYMVDREDVKQIHDVLDELLQKEKLKQLKKQSRLVSEQFRWSKVVESYLSI